MKVSAYNGVSHLAHPSNSSMVQASILFGIRNYYITIQRVGDLRGELAKRGLARKEEMEHGKGRGEKGRELDGGE